MPVYPGLHLGPLPVDRINRTIGAKLIPRHVTVSKAAHEHFALDHPVESPAIMATLASIVASPTFVVRDSKHPHAFYLVEAVESPVGSHALVAIAFKMSSGGTYKVASAYALKAS